MTGEGDHLPSLPRQATLAARYELDHLPDVVVLYQPGMDRAQWDAWWADMVEQLANPPTPLAGQD